MPSFGELLGKWVGGPDEKLLRIERDDNGVTHGEFESKSKDGKDKSGFEGKLLQKGKYLRGFWFDMSKGVTVGHRFVCTLEIHLDEQEDPSGNTMVAKCKTKDGGEVEWKAKRYSEVGDIPRVDKKISTFNFKDEKIFKRVSDFDKAKRQADTDKAREELLATEPHMNFDGSSMYVPPPGVGAEYLSVHDMERDVKKRLAEATTAYRERLARDLEIIKANATNGEFLKKRYAMDEDIAKRFIEIYEKLLNGEKNFDTLMTDRHAFVPSMSEPQLESSKPAEHMPEPYYSEVELYRELAKRDKKHLAGFKERVEKKLEWLQKNLENSEALKKQAMDQDIAKRKMEIYQKLIKGEVTALKLTERKAFYPTEPNWHPDSSKPAEHLPDKYFSSVELDRELARRDKKHWEEYTIKITNEIEYLTKIKDDAEKLKKWALDQDAAGKRIETLGRIVKGQKSELKLAERPAQKPPTKDPGSSRLSGTVMLHPINVRKALRGL
jgi:hypothetical protein